MANENSAEGPALEVIQRSLSGLHDGVVEIVVHDSIIVKLERKERVRFTAAPRNEHATETPFQPSVADSLDEKLLSRTNFDL